MSQIRNYGQTLQATATRRTTGPHGITLVFHPVSEPAAAPEAIWAGQTVEADELPSTERRFRELVSEWKDATRFLSSIHDMVGHPAYLQIIGMGKEALPLLIDELRREPDHWFIALQAITGTNPIPPTVRGDVEKMTQAWLLWAERHGL